MGLGTWALGGALSLVGALSYAELASTYPQSGGDYVYLTRAFGSWLGFLFGWAQLAVIITSSTGAMAFVFGDYAVRLWKLQSEDAALFAVGAVTALTLMNVLGVVLGKWTQNLLSLLKVLGLAGIVVTGFWWGKPGSWVVSQPVVKPDFGLAMIFVLYAYGGWNDMAFVAAELRQRRNITLALILGTAGITIIYLFANAAYISALGFDGVRRSTAVAAEVLQRAGEFGDFGEKGMCLLVMTSALGAMNGLIFTGSRVYARLGTEHSFFAILGRWEPRLGSPVWSLLAQALVTLLMIAAVGTAQGRDGIDYLLTRFRLEPLPWKEYFGGFGTLVAGTAPVFWGFFLLTGLSLFSLRQRDPGIERPFSVPLFPLLPLIFCSTCFYMLYQAIKYAGNLALMGLLPLLLGLPLYWLPNRRPAIEDLAVNE
jgi:amino acid transporter